MPAGSDCGGRKKIIILDSNEELLDAMRSLLARKGFEPEVAGSLVELFDALESGSYDLLLMEHLPERNWDLKVVAENLRQGHLERCIITSSYVMEDYAESEEELGGTVRWLKRPFKISKLLQYIEELI